MLPVRPPLSEIDQAQRKAHAARRALKTVQSEARAALQLVAQLDDELAELRRRHSQPKEAQHAREDREEAVHV